MLIPRTMWGPPFLLTTGLLWGEFFTATGCAKNFHANQNGRATMTTCHRTVAPADAGTLQRVFEELPEQAVLCLQPGHYPIHLILRRSVTLKGLGQPGDIVLNGDPRGGPLVVVDGDGGTVRFSHLTFSGGVANPLQAIGGLYLGSMTHVEMEDAVLRANVSELPGTQAIYATAGWLTLTRCRIQGNFGTPSAVLTFDGVARVALRDTLIADNEGSLPAIIVGGQAQLTLTQTTLVSGRGRVALKISGNPNQTPTARIDGSIVIGLPQALVNGPQFAGQLQVAHSVLSGQAVGHTDGGGNRFTQMRFAAGAEPYTPASGSATVGIAAGPGMTNDLLGHPRRGSAGAIELP